MSQISAPQSTVLAESYAHSEDPRFSLEVCHLCRHLSPAYCAVPAEAHQPSVEDVSNRQHTTSAGAGTHAVPGQQYPSTPVQQQ